MVVNKTAIKNITKVKESQSLKEGEKIEDIRYNRKFYKRYVRK